MYQITKRNQLWGIISTERRICYLFSENKDLAETILQDIILYQASPNHIQDIIEDTLFESYLDIKTCSV
jgi:hypothetical protein